MNHISAGPRTAIPIGAKPCVWFLSVVLVFVSLYSLSTLTTKPAYWYDEAINVELARNFSEFGKLDLVVAPNAFSGQGATVGSTGYPVTVPLAGFFRIFGFGLIQARIYMLLWMGALLIAFFYIAKNTWGVLAAFGGTLLIATFAPFYGNGRSVMGEIPGFLFFLCSFYLFERKRWLWSGLLLGLAVVSKPSVFVFLIPAYAFALLIRNEAWGKRFKDLVLLGASSLFALVPWALLYMGELTNPTVWHSLAEHFKNPYGAFGVSVAENIQRNLGSFFHSTTLIYFMLLLLSVLVTILLSRGIVREHKNLFCITLIYIPLVFLQYLKSFGYLRYLIAAEFLVFILFLITVPVLIQHAARLLCHSRENGNPENDTKYKNCIPVYAGMTVALLVITQLVQLLWFSDLYASDKTQKTLAYLTREYPEEIVGVYNVPHVASLLPADRKYQYISTYGLPQFGINPLLLTDAELPPVLVVDSPDTLSVPEQRTLASHYTRDAFVEGFLVYRKKYSPLGQAPE